MIPTVSLDGDALCIDHPYDPEWVKYLKEVLPAFTGRRWDKRKKVWKVNASHAGLVYQAFPDASYVGEAVEMVNQAGMAKKAQTLDEAPTVAGFQSNLRAYQRVGVYRLGKIGNGMLADEMGLGKTRQAVARIHQTEAKTVLVICPNSVKMKWVDEIREGVPGAEVHMMASEGNRVLPRREQTVFASRWAVVNYDLVRVAHSKRSKPKRGKPDFRKDPRYAKCPSCEGYGRRTNAFKVHMWLCQKRWEAVILDEAHYLKNAKTAQAVGALPICERAQHRIALTGTPVPNRPIELFSILLALGKVRRSEFMPYAKKFCDAKKRYIGRGVEVWDFMGHSNLGELREWVSTFTVRRLKKDVLPELPDKIQERLEVELAPPYRKRYDEALKRLDTLKATESSPTPGILERFAELKLVACEGKLSALQEQIELCLHGGQQAVVFCTRLAPLGELLDRFKGTACRMTGDDSMESRLESMRRFQQGEYRVALCSTEAMGHGVDLTSAGALFHLDCPWTPAVKAQAEDRAHRLGQHQALRVVSLVALDTIDEDLEDICAVKEQVIDQAVPKAQVFRELYRRLGSGSLFPVGPVDKGGVRNAGSIE